MLTSKNQSKRSKRATPEVTSPQIFQHKKHHGRQSSSDGSVEILFSSNFSEEPGTSSSQSEDGIIVFSEAISSSQEENSLPASSLAPGDILTPPSFQPLAGSPSPVDSADQQSTLEDLSPLSEVTSVLVESVEALFKYANAVGSQQHEISYLFDLISKLCGKHLARFPVTIEVAKIFTRLGTGYLEIGELLSAEKTLQSALKFYDELGDISSYELARTWHNLGGVAYRLGYFSTAKEAFDKARDICKQRDDPRLLHINLMALAMVLQHQGCFEEAKHSYEACFKLQDSYVDQTLAKLDRIDSLTKLGDLYNAYGKLQEANRYYEYALRINPNSLNHAHVLVSQSRLLFIAPERALTLLNTSLSIKNQLDDDESLDALTGLSYISVYLVAGYLKEAAELLKSVKTLQIISKKIDKPLVIEMLILEGELLRHTGHVRRSIHTFTSALEMATGYYGLLRPVLFGQIHLALAKTYQDYSLDQAYKEAEKALTIFEQYPLDANHPWMRDALDLFTATASVKDTPNPVLGSSSVPSFWELSLVVSQPSIPNTFASNGSRK